jgi:N-acetylglucosaminyl-diphospho-decaprenol L-rhamnosyltransferase
MSDGGSRRPDVSVVVVSYRCRELLRECLESVSAQRDDLGLEVFVVDNASGDGTDSMVRDEFPWVDFTDTGANLGFAKPNNMALRRSTGRAVLILNPDTVIPHGGLRQCTDELWRRPEVGMLTPRLVTRQGHLDRRCKRGFPTAWSSFCYFTGLDRVITGPRSTRYTMGTLGEHEVGVVEAISGAFMLVKAEVLGQVGFFDEQFFMYAEDIDLSLRITEAGWAVLYWPVVDVIHVGAGSNTGGVRPPAADAAYFRTMAPFIRKHRPGIRGRVLALAVRLVSEGMYAMSRMRSVVSGRRQGRAG